MLRLSDHSRTSRGRWRRAGFVGALVATLALVGCMPAAASDVHVRQPFFGIHDSTKSALSFAEIHSGAVRLWDAGVQWQEIETRRPTNGHHHYNWTKLDTLVSRAQQAHAEVTMVVGRTPRFYSKDPTQLPPKSIPAYRSFVQALMQRYKKFDGHRGIDAYQVWNESNVSTFWTGSIAEMGQLTKVMHDVRNKVDKGALVVAPSMVTRLDYQLGGLTKFYAQRVGGRAVWRYVDAIALSMYPLPTYGRRAGVPEDSIRQLNHVKRLLHQDGVPSTKAIWNTEINYGLQSGSKGGTRTTPISDARQASNVMRTYLLYAANGVKRVFWYRYNWWKLPTGGNLSNTLLTSPTDSSHVTAAGHAYRRVQQWMHGTLLGTAHGRPCPKDRHGTYTCVVKDGTGKRFIYWNPFHTDTVRLPRSVHHVQGVLGATSAAKPGSTLKVTYKPVMASH
jgi:polysaccharide biosynthesis protein PslG